MSSLLPFLALQSSSGGGLSTGFWVIYAIFIVIAIVASWKIFTKAGKPGWASIIPIYNLVVYIDIIGRPLWWIILMFVPIVNFIVAIVMTNDFSKSFGQGVGFTIGLLIPGLNFILLLYLAFGDAQYVGPAAA